MSLKKTKLKIRHLVIAGVMCFLTVGFKATEKQKDFDYVAFQPGEFLKYDLHFGSIHAGEAILQVFPKLETIAGQQHYHIQITGNSFSIFDAFYKVRDNYESYVNKSTRLPTIFLRNVLEGSYKKREYYIFNRPKNQVVSGKNIFEVPSGVQDLVSAFYYLRCIDFSNVKPGTFVPITTFFDDEIFPLGITFEKRETISTDLGKIKCLVFKPKLIKGRVFKDQSDMTLYVSDDKNQLPVRIKSAVYLGYVKADLKEFRNLKFPFSAMSEN
jgi:hypothetical protein